VQLIDPDLLRIMTRIRAAQIQQPDGWRCPVAQSSGPYGGRSLAW
jgi:hypothetical protein